MLCGHGHARVFVLQSQIDTYKTTAINKYTLYLLNGCIMFNFFPVFLFVLFGAGPNPKNEFELLRRYKQIYIFWYYVNWNGNSNSSSCHNMNVAFTLLCDKITERGKSKSWFVYWFIFTKCTNCRTWWYLWCCSPSACGKAHMFAHKIWKLYIRFDWCNSYIAFGKRKTACCNRSVTFRHHHRLT